MKPFPTISEGEWEVMEILWRQDSPITALAIVQALMPHHAWKDTTIRTMLGRLVQKRAVGFIAEGNLYLYHAQISRNECVERVSDTFLERIFAGATGLLVLHFLKTKSLTDAELAELGKMLQKKREL